MFLILNVQVSVSIFMAMSLPDLSDCLDVVLSLFWLLLQSIAAPHLRLFSKEKKAGPSHSFFHSSLSCCVLCILVVVLPHAFLF